MFGESAFLHSARNEQTTGYDIIRYIGVPFETAQKSAANAPFNIVDASSQAAFVLGERNMSAVDALVGNLKVVRSEMEDSVGAGNLQGVVVALPGTLSQEQKLAILGAVAKSGMPVVGSVDSAVAAAMAAGLDVPAPQHPKESSLYLVVETGVNVRATLLRISSMGLIQVVGAREAPIGGDELDEALLAYFVEDYQRKNRTSISTDRRAKAKIRKAAEQAKRALSQTANTTIDLESVHDGNDYTGQINRGRFEILCSPLLGRWCEPITQLFEAHAIGPHDLAGYLLTGGSSNLPVVRQCFETLLSVVPSIQTAPEAAVHGAALQASIQQLHSSLYQPPYPAGDTLSTAPRSISLAIDEQQSQLLIPQGHPLPVSIIRDLTTLENNQQAVVMTLKDEQSTILGKIVIDNLPPHPAGLITIRATFRLDETGDLHVLATSFDHSRTPISTISFVV